MANKNETDNRKGAKRHTMQVLSGGVTVIGAYPADAKKTNKTTNKKPTQTGNE